MRVRAALVGLALAAALAAVVGATGPWAWIETVPYDGTESNAGRVALAAAVVAGLLLAAAAAARAAWLALLATVPAAAAAIIAGYHASNPDRYVGSSLPGVAEVGWGAVVTIAGACALVALGLGSTWLFRRSGH